MLASMATSAEAAIRRASLDDYDAVCRLLDVVDLLHAERLPWLFQTPSTSPRPEPYFAELLSGPDSTLFVAEAEQLVGVAIALMRSAPALPVLVPQRWGVLDGLVVDPAWRRRGVGARLVQAVESWAHALGAAWVELNVYEFNAEARRFYEALGYLPLSTKLRKTGRAAE